MYYRAVAHRAISDTGRVLKERTAEEVVLTIAGAASGAAKFLATTCALSFETAGDLFMEAASGAAIFVGVAVVLVTACQFVLAPARLAQAQREKLAALTDEHKRELAAREVRISELLREVGRWRSDFLLAFTRDQLKRRYGEASRRRPVDKMKELRQLFSDREEEIERGDYSRAAEIIDIIRYYEPTLERWLKGKGGYEREMSRIRRMEAKVERFVAENPRQAASSRSTDAKR